METCAHKTKSLIQLMFKTKGKTLVAHISYILTELYKNTHYKYKRSIIC